MKKSLRAKLKAYKDHPAFGGMTDEAFERVRARVQEATGANELRTEPLPSVYKMYFEYLRHNAAQYLSRPVIAGAFSLVIVAGGWLTTVRAADSLPGQTLYSVKMITERAQLKLASLDRKAVLHTEFAGRRLHEANELRADTNTGNDSLVHSTLEAYKQEVTSAGESLRQLKDEDSVATLATATSVQDGLQAIGSTIDQVAADSVSVEASQEALDAREVAQAVSDVATTVVVEVHEQDQSELSANELKSMFKQDLGEIGARQQFDLARLGVIEIALADVAIDFTNFTVPTAVELQTLEYAINSADDTLSEAMNSFAIGGYRAAFATLQEIDSTLLNLEAQLAQIEFMIMDARVQPLPAPQVSPSL